MLEIQGITSDPLQQQNIVLPDGTSVVFTMYFIPMQYGWFFTSIVCGNFTLKGLRICNNPNMLYQFKNQIPFGIGCFSTGNQEPSQQQSFSSGVSKMYILSEDEVTQYARFLSGEVLA